MAAKQISLPDRHYVNAAEGWLELGNPEEAKRELAQVAPHLRLHPDVLEMSWRIFARKRDWEGALNIAQAMTRLACERPDGWIYLSFSLHELSRTREALEILLEIVERFPEVSAISYNIACYACQLGLLPEAEKWLHNAFSHGNSLELKLMAADDPDLKPLWPKLAMI
jgi:tetratricopeptide (TPR) repeat protein